MYFVFIYIFVKLQFGKYCCNIKLVPHKQNKSRLDVATHTNTWVYKTHLRVYTHTRTLQVNIYNTVKLFDYYRL